MAGDPVGAGSSDAATYFLSSIAVSEEDEADLASLSKLSKVDPVLEAILSVSLIGRVSPLTRRHVASSASLYECRVSKHYVLGAASKLIGHT